MERYDPDEVPNITSNFSFVKSEVNISGDYAELCQSCQNHDRPMLQIYSSAK